MRLEKPLVIFDIESTGVDTVKDRIIEIAGVKLHPDGKQEEFKYLVNPNIPIPPQATAVHGITDNMVSNKPFFYQLAPLLKSRFFDGSDIGGYKSDSFDVPMLIAEFGRCGLEFEIDGRNFVDVLKLQRHVHPQTLEAVYTFYTGEQMQGAHGALNDSKATLTIFNKILEKHFNDEITPKELDLLLQGEKKRVDISGKLAYNENGEVVWTFGKHLGKVVTEEMEYLNWVLSPKKEGQEDFPPDTKSMLEIIKHDFYSNKFL